MFCVAVLMCLMLSSEGHDVPDFNLTLSSKHNISGDWYAEVQLGHKGNHTWDVYVDHTTVNWNGTDSIIIDVKLIAPTNQANATSVEVTNPRPTRESVPNNSALVNIGYQLLEGFGYYKVHTERKDWASAVQTCEDEGAHLLLVNSVEEAHKLGELIHSHRLHNTDVWVGIHQVGGEWLTIFDETAKSTAPKEMFNFSNNSGANCVYFFYYASSQYYLRDYFCNMSDEFICEKELM